MPTVITILRPSVPNNTACIYRIKVGSRYFYIGASICLNTRVTQHASNIKKGKIGEFKIPYFNHKDNVVFDILELISEDDDLFERERYYIDAHKGKRGFINNLTALMYRENRINKPYKTKKNENWSNTKRSKGG